METLIVVLSFVCVVLVVLLVNKNVVNARLSMQNNDLLRQLEDAETKNRELRYLKEVSDDEFSTIFSFWGRCSDRYDFNLYAERLETLVKDVRSCEGNYPLQLLNFYSHMLKIIRGKEEARQERDKIYKEPSHEIDINQD